MRPNCRHHIKRETNPEWETSQCKKPRHEVAEKVCNKDPPPRPQWNCTCRPSIMQLWQQLQLIDHVCGTKAPVNTNLGLPSYTYGNFSQNEMDQILLELEKEMDQCTLHCTYRDVTCLKVSLMPRYNCSDGQTDDH